MAKEAPTFRADIEHIHTATGKYLLTATDVAKFLGKSRVFVMQHFDIPKVGITASALALQLAELK